jgi:hypothetical protein
VAFAFVFQLAVLQSGQQSNSSMQAIIKLSITEHSLTVTNVVNIAFKKDDKVKEQCLLVHGYSLLET